MIFIGIDEVNIGFPNGKYMLNMLVYDMQRSGVRNSFRDQDFDRGILIRIYDKYLIGHVFSR